MTPQQIGTKRYTSEKYQKKRDEKCVENLEIAFSSCDDGNHDVTIEELAEEMDVSEKTVKRHIKKSGHFITVNEPGKKTVVKRADDRDPSEI